MTWQSDNTCLSLHVSLHDLETNFESSDSICEMASAD